MGRGIPKYRRHPNGSAFVQHKSIERPGHRLYLGKYDTPESRERYRVWIAELEAKQTGGPPPPRPASDITVSELCELYLVHCEKYYKGRDGKLSSEVNVILRGVDAVTRVYGSLPAAQFGPLKLDEVRQAIIATGITRRTVNSYVSRIKRIFQWGCAKEMIPPHVYGGLRAVKGLAMGRSDAPDLEPIAPVALETVIATLPHCSSTVAAMIRVQFWCGMRPVEVCQMRRQEIDDGRDVWLYRPAQHKNSWRGKRLVKAIPTQAQDALRPFMSVAPDAYLFKPTPRPNSGSHLNAKSYLHAIWDACDRAFMPPPPLGREGAESVTKWKRRLSEEQRAELERWNVAHRWSPNRLRHAIATVISESMGEQAASRWLGHDKLQTTAIYVEKQVNELLAIAAQVAQQTEVRL
jgi:integrase